MTMTVPTILTGVILAALGLYGYLNGTPDAETGTVSPTALIPTAFGAVLLVCGLMVAVRPALRKHVMHLAAVVGLLGFFGGFMPVMRGYGKTGAVDFGKPSVQVGLAMSLICLVFIGLCVKSFIDARRARKAVGG